MTSRRQPELRRYILALDPRDPRDAMLIALLDHYERTKFIPDNSGRVSIGIRCEICGVEFASETGKDLDAVRRNARRALSAHIRQMHPQGEK